MVGLFAIFSNENNVSLVCDYFNKADAEDTFRSCNFKSDCFFCRSKTIRKFEEDKLFEFSNDVVVETDGVILNSEELVHSYNSKKLSELLLNAYTTGVLGNVINECRGSFSGVICDLLNNKITAYVDHFSTKTLFYSQNDETFIISSDVYMIVETLKVLGINFDLDEVGAYSLLSYGYMLGNHTLVRGIKRISEGSILNFKNGEVCIDSYHKFDYSEKKISMNDAIDRIDNLFKRAVRLQHKKNFHHGYLDVVPLSAGMDCRMTSFVLRSISTYPILNFTYSETGQYDEVVPPKMAKIQGNRWLFKSLDNGLDLMNIEQSIQLSDSIIKYDWTAQLSDFLKIVNTSDWGIVSTGVIGDVIVGCFEKSEAMHRDYRIGDGAFSQYLIEKLKTIVERESPLPVMSYEEGMISNRAINGACLGYSRTFRHVAEDLSPFMNVDFAEFCFSLPKEYRRNHRIYYEWVKKRYPQAAKFKHNGIRIDGKTTISYHGRKYTVKSLMDVVINKIKRDVIKTGYGMNPQQTWYNQNPDLRNAMDSYYENHIGVLEPWDDIKADVIELYSQGAAGEKILAISLLGSVDYIFS